MTTHPGGHAVPARRLVIDVDLPCINGLSTVRDLRWRLPETEIVALAAAKPAGLVQRLLAADVLGAVDKGVPAASLLEAIRGAAKGGLVIDKHQLEPTTRIEPSGRVTATDDTSVIHPTRRGSTGKTRQVREDPLATRKII